MTTKKRKSARWLAYLAILGPGLLAASAGNDAGGIATYAQAGAAYKYTMLWLLLVITFPLVAVFEMCARMGAVTGKGLSDLIRENYGVKWTVFAMITMGFANFVSATANFAGVAAAFNMFGVPSYISVPIFAILLWLLLVRGNYNLAERVLLLFAGLFLAYPIAAFTVHPNWGEVFKMMLIPNPEWITHNGQIDIQYLQVAIGLIGTTIAPWMTFYLQASVVDKGERKQDLPMRRFDVISGALSANIIAFFIIVTTAVMHQGYGMPMFNDAGEAADALRNLVHGAAPILFGLGLLGASVLGAAAVPLTTCYSITEAFGWERGLDHKFREAPIFFGLLTAMIVIGSLLVIFTPKEMLFKLILFSQVINGILVPIIMVFIVLLANNKRLLGDYSNSKSFNFIAWSSVGLIATMSTVWLTLQVIGMLK